MNSKGKLMGLGKVYKFSLHQLFKSKSNLISFGVFILVAIISVPAMCLFMDGDSAGTSGFSSEVMTMEEFFTRDEVGFDARYGVQMAYSVLVMIVCIFSCSYIVRSIIEEKSSKLVETLMVSVKSESMILGKIFAVMTFIFVMIGLLFTAFGVSYFVTGMFMDTSVIGNTLAGMGITSDLLNIGPEVILVAVVSLLFAYMTFALISALSGAGCSNMEDVEAANMTAMMVILIGYMAATMASAFGSAPVIFMSLCPILSAFAAPANFIIGDIGFLTLLGSWAIQILCIFLIHKLSGRVYDSLIMYKGNRLKMRQIISMAGINRKGEK
ncbi:MAG: ABC transporter permease [Firmicutes bacterium]|jgi:ABC-2 type transport system permease protein|nr:ABC transporter permease [Bacillota bacterium]